MLSVRRDNSAETLCSAEVCQLYGQPLLTTYFFKQWKLSKNDDGSYVRPATSGVEAAALGAGAASDIQVEGLGVLETGAEVVTGGLLSYSIYTAVLTALDTIPQVRSK